MQFLHPGLLFALFALAIPVIIHLFNFRRYKTVYFSNVKFLREVKEETASRSKLKHLLVLAARLLAFAFLIFAFAQPYIPRQNTTLAAGRKNISVYIDNSFSMNAVHDGRSLFDRAKLTAREIVNGASADDRFQLLTNDFEGKHQRLVGQEAFFTMLDEVEISPVVRNLSDVAKRQRDALSRENEENRVAYLLSDFQQNMADLAPDSFISYNLIPLAADEQANVYIDTVWFNEPVQLLQQQAQLIVKITNSGEKAVENNRLVMKLNGQTKTMTDFGVEAGSFRYDTLSFLITESGWNRADLQIQDFPITYDDTYFLSFRVIDKINVLAIGEGRTNPFLDALFNNQPEFSFTSVMSADFNASMTGSSQLIILDNLRSISASLSASLNNYVSEGGAVVVFPGHPADVESYNRFLNSLRANAISTFSEEAQDVSTINLQQNVFKDVFERVPANMNLPSVKKYYMFTRSTVSNEESILTLKNGTSFFSRYPYQKGSVYVCASPLLQAYSDLPVHAIFAPMLYKTAVLNITSGSNTYFIGSRTRIEVTPTKGSTDKTYKITGDDVEFIPEQFAFGNKMLLGLNEQVKKAGFYQIAAGNSDSTDLLALNFDRKESDLRFFGAEELKGRYTQPNVQVVDGARAEISSVVKVLNRGTPLWKWCILLTLLFLSIEVALLRFWKV